MGCPFLSTKISLESHCNSAIIYYFLWLGVGRPLHFPNQSSFKDIGVTECARPSPLFRFASTIELTATVLSKQPELDPNNEIQEQRKAKITRIQKNISIRNPYKVAPCTRPKCSARVIFSTSPYYRTLSKRNDTINRNGYDRSQTRERTFSRKRPREGDFSRLKGRAARIIKIGRPPLLKTILPRHHMMCVSLTFSRFTPVLFAPFRLNFILTRLIRR